MLSTHTVTARKKLPYNCVTVKQVKAIIKHHKYDQCFQNQFDASYFNGKCDAVVLNLIDVFQHTMFFYGQDCTSCKKTLL